MDATRITRRRHRGAAPIIAVIALLVNSREFGDAFPFTLFVPLWALPTAIAKVTESTVKRIHSGFAGSHGQGGETGRVSSLPNL